MSALALVGSAALLMLERMFSRFVLPLVALAADALLGGALFHMLPESVAVIGNDLSIYVWVAAGILSFRGNRVSTSTMPEMWKDRLDWLR